VYEHGAAIASKIGHQASAETFNPVIVDFYREVGYLPHALLNYLVLLGWALDDKTEFFTLEEMIRNFSLERVNKAPASFDPAKLLAFQEHYMVQEPVASKSAIALSFLRKAKITDASALPVVTAIVTAAKDRIKVAGDILDYADFFTPDDQLPYDEAAFDKRLRKPPEAVPLLRKFRDRLAVIEPFDAGTLEGEMNRFVEAEGVKIAQIIHSLRVAVTGKAVGFGMFDTLAILGKQHCLARIDRSLARL
jgi:glutamyl-tRNA synthetase